MDLRLMHPRWLRSVESRVSDANGEPGSIIAHVAGKCAAPSGDAAVKANGGNRPTPTRLDSRRDGMISAFACLLFDAAVNFAGW